MPQHPSPSAAVPPANVPPAPGIMERRLGLRNLAARLGRLVGGSVAAGAAAGAPVGAAYLAAGTGQFNVASLATPAWTSPKRKNDNNPASSAQPGEKGDRGPQPVLSGYHAGAAVNQSQYSSAGAIAGGASPPPKLPPDIVAKFDVEELDVLKKIYKELSGRCGTGEGIDRETFAQYFSELPALWASRLFLKFAANQQEYVDWESFVGVLALIIRGTKSDKQRVLFDLFDLDSDDKLSPQELTLMLANISDIGVCFPVPPPAIPVSAPNLPGNPASSSGPVAVPGAAVATLGTLPRTKLLSVRDDFDDKDDEEQFSSSVGGEPTSSLLLRHEVAASLKASELLDVAEAVDAEGFTLTEEELALVADRAAAEAGRGGAQTHPDLVNISVTQAPGEAQKTPPDRGSVSDDEQRSISRNQGEDSAEAADAQPIEDLESVVTQALLDFEGEAPGYLVFNEFKLFLQTVPTLYDFFIAALREDLWATRRTKFPTTTTTSAAAPSSMAAQVPPSAPVKLEVGAASATTALDSTVASTVSPAPNLLAARPPVPQPAGTPGTRTALLAAAAPPSGAETPSAASDAGGYRERWVMIHSLFKMPQASRLLDSTNAAAQPASAAPPPAPLPAGQVLAGTAAQTTTAPPPTPALAPLSSGSVELIGAGTTSTHHVPAQQQQANHQTLEASATPSQIAVRSQSVSAAKDMADRPLISGAPTGQLPRHPRYSGSVEVLEFLAEFTWNTKKETTAELPPPAEESPHTNETPDAPCTTRKGSLAEEELTEVLSCPNCHAPLLSCIACGKKFPQLQIVAPGASAQVMVLAGDPGLSPQVPPFNANLPPSSGGQVAPGAVQVLTGQGLPLLPIATSQAPGMAAGIQSGAKPAARTPPAATLPVLNVVAASDQMVPTVAKTSAVTPMATASGSLVPTPGGGSSTSTATGEKLYVVCSQCTDGKPRQFARCWVCNWAFQGALQMIDRQRPVLLEGPLYKLSKREQGPSLPFSAFGLRYCVLIDKLLYYYARRTDVQPRGFIFLDGCFIESIDVATVDSTKDPLVPVTMYGFAICQVPPPSGAATSATSAGHSNSSKERREMFSLDKATRNRWVVTLRQTLHQEAVEELFEFKEIIGNGRFSVVYRATERSTAREVAIKVINKPRMQSHERELLRSEMSILRLLKHPHVIQLKSIVDSRECLYLVMEIVRGGELYDILGSRGRLPEAQVQRIIAQLLKTVAYLHKCGIVHRDLKLENILLTTKTLEQANIKIADFGISSLCGPNEKLFQPCGTLVYVAPEVLIMKGYSHQVDLWSIGVIMHLLLRGKVPFPVVRSSGPTVLQHLEKFYSLKFEEAEWTNVSRHAQELIRRLCTVDPEQRITAEQALKHIWVQNPTAVLKDLGVPSAPIHTVAAPAPVTMQSSSAATAESKTERADAKLDKEDTKADAAAGSEPAMQTTLQAAAQHATPPATQHATPPATQQATQQVSQQATQAPMQAAIAMDAVSQASRSPGLTNGRPG